jgi:hypothetical protein
VGCSMSGNDIRSAAVRRRDGLPGSPFDLLNDANITAAMPFHV